jgi:hypothetical protein
VLQVLIYIQIPVLYFARMTDPAFAQLGAAGLEGATAFWVVSDARLLLLAVFWAWSCWRFVRTVMRPEREHAEPEAMDPLKTDCRHFRPDRPCAPHKAHGVVCATCTEYLRPDHDARAAS